MKRGIVTPEGLAQSQPDGPRGSRAFCPVRLGPLRVRNHQGCRRGAHADAEVCTDKPSCAKTSPTALMEPLAKWRQTTRESTENTQALALLGLRFRNSETHTNTPIPLQS